MRYISLFSGIEAASCAWHPLGWESVAFAEIEPFPSSVLAHHFPSIPNLGDITAVDWSAYRGTAELVVGGSPCQSFSVAGLRKGLADPRGNLALEYLRAVDGVRPEWVVWENVPGVLSADGGRAFGTFLGGLAELGYGFCYRVLDAQYVRVQSHTRAVPQRRRRVFVVGCLGDWRRAAAVLLERESLCGHPAPRREAGAGVAALTAHGVGTCGADDNQAQAGHVIALEVAPTLTINGDAHSALRGVDGCLAFSAGNSADAYGIGLSVEHTPPLRAADSGTNQVPTIATGYAVRRLTPRECERLQGFPDDWTLVEHRGKPAADGPRYKAIGNSMAVNVMRFIGERIQAVQQSAPATCEGVQACGDVQPLGQVAR